VARRSSFSTHCVLIVGLTARLVVVVASVAVGVDASILVVDLPSLAPAERGTTCSALRHGSALVVGAWIIPCDARYLWRTRRLI